MSNHGNTEQLEMFEANGKTEDSRTAIRNKHADATTPLSNAIPLFLTYLSSLGRSQHTLQSFLLDLNMLKGHLGDVAIGTIDTTDLRQFVTWVRTERDNSPNSLRRKVATLKNFFGYLRDQEFLQTSAAELVPYPEAFLALPEFLETKAVLRLYEAAESNPFWYALLVLMIDTGLKRDEVLALRVADVQLPDDTTPGYLVVRETDAAKRLRSRRLPLPPRLADALRAYYSEFPRVSGDERVFDISIRGINFIVETCGARAGVVTSKPRLTPQVLRETFAVTEMRARAHEEGKCIERGWDTDQMQLMTLRHDAELLELLGLKDDPETARKYRKLIGSPGALVAADLPL